MENYIHFLNRTNAFETEKLQLDDRQFVPRDSLKSKVNPDNTFRNFYGDTVVFKLPTEVMWRTSSLIDALYKEAPECFAKRLPDESLHITLHDLVSSENVDDVQADMNQNAKVMSAIRFCKMIPHRAIRVRATYIINMINTSLVLAIQPSSKLDYQHIMKLYSIFDDVIKLPYRFTPHITLAYYNVNGFGAESIKNLTWIVNKLNQGQSGFEFFVDTKNLFYQSFLSMEEYIDVLCFGK